MQKYEKIIVAAIVAVGLLMLGLCIKGGIDNFTNKDRRVTVKGLAEKEVDADKVTWTMGVQASGDELKPLFSVLSTQADAIQQFLKEKGIKGKGDVTVNTYDVTDNLANVWGDNQPRYHYTVRRNVKVTSKDTQFISQLRQKVDELIDRGVILESDYAEYEYTQFQQLKPEMMAEAISNAEKTACQFAENSHSTINKIVEAGQGEFSIDEADIPYKKKVRVVSTITYSLKD
ncbi:MAG: SIMPL domain-containing protein [Bacteroidaceae bacterium]|nr:SIMPL domain-containing protein [Bacteroidaceae bacterium]